MTIARRSVDHWLSDIVHWGQRAEHYVEDMSFADFSADTRTQDAVVRCIENIGEAASRLLKTDPTFEEENEGLELSSAYRARNRVSHGYFSIDLAIVWEAVRVSIPKLTREAECVLDKRKLL